MIFNIKKDNDVINTIISSLQFVVSYCEENGYTYEEVKEIKDVSLIIQEKISELSSSCDKTINNGTSVKLTDGSEEQFSYTIEDQTNIKELFDTVRAGATAWPYHQNDGSCKVYSAQDIQTIYLTLAIFKTSVLTYFNQLKQYVKTLTTEDEVNAVYYGQKLTGEYLENYNAMMQEAKTQMETVVGSMGLIQAN